MVFFFSLSFIVIVFRCLIFGVRSRRSRSSWVRNSVGLPETSRLGLLSYRSERRGTTRALELGEITFWLEIFGRWGIDDDDVFLELTGIYILTWAVSWLMPCTSRTSEVLIMLGKKVSVIVLLCPELVRYCTVGELKLDCSMFVIRLGLTGFFA